MRLPARIPSSQDHPAHRIVLAADAQRTSVDWPVSGDETWRQYGRDGRRDRVNLWTSPGVIPKIATTGIRVGDTIVTWDGKGEVTRVGTIAGFYMLGREEVQWTIDSVTRIIPAVTHA